VRKAEAFGINTKPSAASQLLTLSLCKFRSIFSQDFLLTCGAGLSSKLLLVFPPLTLTIVTLQTFYVTCFISALYSEAESSNLRQSNFKIDTKRLTILIQSV